MNLQQKLNAWIISRIIELSINHGISIHELARKSNLSTTTIQNIISGKTTPKLETIASIAMVLSGTLDKFFETVDDNIAAEVHKYISNGYKL
ncbi:helix-turn-helix transcriptional regulator [Phascolarctobacterium faecium]|uniref:helix-turn-helix domain-containing protein n=1 Tax=Phascolarctobacterium faecium TaxID=33025 RepID=UPI002E8DEF6E|nr:helix-turn-helix transcriptional regulator [Phascolarctobacterium faecium]